MRSDRPTNVARAKESPTGPHPAPASLEFDRRMGLDASAVATLELFESSDGSESKSLCATLDRTRTPVGARALRDALAHPSLDPVELEARWDAVEELVGKPEAAEELRAALEAVGDVERRFARVSVGTAGPREVAGLGAGLGAVPGVVRAASPLETVGAWADACCPACLALGLFEARTPSA